jgi:hypothetical protein
MTDYGQARIRLSEEGAHEAWAALDRYEVFILDARDLTSPGDDRKRLNRRIGAVRRIQKELARTMAEQGWITEVPDGELQRPQP